MSGRKQRQRELGTVGEARALAWLQDHDYQILARNFRVGKDEIDLVAWDQRHQEVVFCEVKTRASDDWGSPADACDSRKMTAQVRAAQAYLQTHTRNDDYRFDLIAVLPGTIQHFQNITWP
jgi:putative endonuclease